MCCIRIGTSMGDSQRDFGSVYFQMTGQPRCFLQAHCRFGMDQRLSCLVLANWDSPLRFDFRQPRPRQLERESLTSLCTNRWCVQGPGTFRSAQDPCSRSRFAAVADGFW